MIFVVASMGTDRIAPGIPHIQNQNTSAMMTRTGRPVFKQRIIRVPTGPLLAVAAEGYR
jgi:hypothetical protein